MSVGEILLKRYRVVEELGAGPCAVTRVVGCLTTGKLLVVKQRRSAERADAFLDAVRATAPIVHAHLTEIHDFGLDELGRPWVARELVEGRSAAELVLREAPLGVEQCVELVTQLLSGLAALHAAGLSHLGVKPENVFVTYPSPGRPLVKLLDAGQAAAAVPDAVLRFPRQLGYAAPELLSERPHGAPADLYAAGALLYELLSGAVVAPAGAVLGETERDFSGDRESAVFVLSERLAAPLGGLLRRALDPRPEARPASAAEFAAELGAFESAVPRVAPRRATRRQPIDRTRGRLGASDLAARALRNPQIPQAARVPRISLGYDDAWLARRAGPSAAEPEDDGVMSGLLRWLAPKKRGGAA